MGTKLLQPRLTELGKIKIGGKGAERQGKKGAWRMPVKYDYFVVTGHERDSAGNLKPDKELMSRLLERYGTDVEEAEVDSAGNGTGKTKVVRRLREIPVALLSDEIDDSLSAVYSYYVGKRRCGTCDGETFTKFAEPKDGEWVALQAPISKPCDGKHHLGEGWKLHTTLQVVIADGEARWGGVYRFRTTSAISADQLLGTMLQVKTLTRGILAGLPLRLVVRPMEVSPDGKATTIYVVHLELRGADLNAIQQQALQIAQTNVRNARELSAASHQLRALLAAPESDEEQADAAEEFHPGPEQARVVVEAQPAPAPALAPAKKDPLADLLTVPAKLEPAAAPPASPPVAPAPNPPAPAAAAPAPTAAPTQPSPATESDEVDFPF